MKLSERLGDYLISAGLSLLLVIACHQPNDSNNEVSSAVSIKDTVTINTLLRKARTFNQTNFDSMRWYAKEALALAELIQWGEGIAKAEAVECNYQRRKGNYAGAISIGLKVLKRYDSLGLWKDEIGLKNYLADIYKEMGGEKAIVEYLRKGLELSKQGQELAERKNYIPGIVTSLNQQGITLRDLSGIANRSDLMDSAFVLYQQGIKIIEQTGEGKDDLGKFYNNIAQVYNEHFKDYPMALSFLKKAIAFNTGRNNQNSLTYNYDVTSYVYQNMGNFDSANHYGHKMLGLSKKLKAPYRMVNAFLVLTNANKKANRNDSALYYYEQSVALADSMNNLERSGQITEMQTKYETEKKEVEIASLNSVNKIRSQRLWIAGGIAALFAIAVLISVMQNRRLQKQKKQITAQSDRLKWMMKELHHRVKNNLQIVSSLLNLQTYRLKDEESISAIKESQLRVQAMSLIHQRLYQVDDVSKVNFKLYLDDLVDTLMRSFGFNSTDFDLQIHVEKEFLDVDMVMPMGLLVNEILTNSFKYAYTETKHPLLHISLLSVNQQFQLEIKDNGPGLNWDAGEPSKPGFGKKLIDALSKQLKAVYSVDTALGTAYHFNIPQHEEKAA